MKVFLSLILTLIPLPTYAQISPCYLSSTSVATEIFVCNQVVDKKTYAGSFFSVKEASLCLVKQGLDQNATLSLMGSVFVSSTARPKGHAKAYDIFHIAEKYSDQNSDKANYFTDYDDQIFLFNKSVNKMDDVVYFQATYDRLEKTLEISEYQQNIFTNSYSISAKLSCQ